MKYDRSAVLGDGVLEHSDNVKAHGVARLRYSFGHLKKLEIELVKLYELLVECGRGKQSD